MVRKCSFLDPPSRVFKVHDYDCENKCVVVQVCSTMTAALTERGAGVSI